MTLDNVLKVFHLMYHLTLSNSTHHSLHLPSIIDGDSSLTTTKEYFSNMITQLKSSQCSGEFKHGFLAVFTSFVSNEYRMEQTALFSLGERSTQVSAGTDPRGGPEQEG